MKKLCVGLLCAALALAGCGSNGGSSARTADEFCDNGRGGVDVRTLEPDGDATCQDGTEFEDPDDGKKKKTKSKKKGKR